MTPLDDDSSVHSSPAGRPDPLPVNDVRLIGHLSKSLEMKEMPSGDLLGKWALVVKRRPRDDADGDASSESSGSAINRRRQSHDTIDCISFDMELIERLSDVPPRTRLEVHGALRRRFRRNQPGQSSYEVEAFAVAVLSTPAPVEKAEAAEPAKQADPAASAELLTASG